MSSNIYESNTLISQYCEFHYGEEYFGIENYPKKTIDAIKPFLQNTTKALDLGCSVGRSSFELSKLFSHVDAIDYSHAFIEIAQTLQTQQYFDYNITVEGEINESKQIVIKEYDFSNSLNQVSFSQGNASNLDTQFTQYDLIFCSNLIDRLQEPQQFLDDIKKRLNPKGILVICSPYTWLHDHTHKEKWFGGFIQNNTPIYTFDALKNYLNDFKLLHTQDIEFVIRETKRKFQHTISQMSIWQNS